MKATAGTAANVDGVIVRTEQGRLAGVAERGVYAFLGIPYARAPYGAQRFRPPAEPPRWDGTRPADAYAATCPQQGIAPEFASIYPDEPCVPGEECLNLNVWTPDPGAVGLPVMVWVHGGAFVTGSGAHPWFRGTSFARDGVVCVTLNYRLAAEGFLTFEDGTANLGLQDIAAALRWVQANIAAFGGDPGKVTLAGQSAGGMAVTCLLAMPSARGLFRAAVASAGAGHHTMGPDLAGLVTSRLAELLDIRPTREEFAGVPTGRLTAAASALNNELAAGADPARWGELALTILPFMPAIDGTVLPSRPLEVISAGATADVALLAGSNADDGRLFVVPTGLVDVIDDATLEQAAAARGLGRDGLAAYRSSSPHASPGDLFGTLMTDWFYRIPAIRLAETHAAASRAGTWMYSFETRTPQLDARLGAVHALELSYIFDTIDEPSAEILVGPAPSAEAAATTHATWVEFVSRLDPGWPRYDTSARTTALLDRTCTLADDPHPQRRQAWNGVR